MQHYHTFLRLLNIHYSGANISGRYYIYFYILLYIFLHISISACIVYVHIYVARVLYKVYRGSVKYVAKGCLLEHTFADRT